MKNPLKGLHFANLELKSILNSYALRIALVGVALIPLLYGALYLWAFLDPYGRLDTMPVAVVNLDEGAIINGEQRNLGAELVDSLKHSDEGFAWEFVDSSAARDGMRDNTYYMTAVIPAKFSEDIASLDSNSPEQAALEVTYNESANLVASQLGNAVWQRVSTQLSNKITTLYAEGVFEKIATGASSLETAASGADELHRGLRRGSLGSTAISDGLGGLEDGVDALRSGMGQLATGADTLAAGVEQFNGYLPMMAQGVGGLSDGAQLLAQQTAAMPEQTALLAQGAAGVDGGLQASIDAIGSADVPDATLLYASAQVSDNLATVAGQGGNILAGTDQFINAVGSASTAATLANDQITAAIAALDPNDPANAQTLAALYTAQQVSDQLAGELATVSGNSAQIRSQAEDLVNGIDSLHAASSGVTTGLGALKDGLTTLKGYSGQLSNGTAALAQAAPLLSNGTAALASGASQLNDSMPLLTQGATGLASGTSALASGLHSAAEGIAPLASGISQLHEGSVAVTEGIVKAEGGSEELATKLEEGAASMNINERQISAKSTQIAQPLQLSKSYYTQVKNYGSGFAPYFIALGIWLGALMVSFIVKPLNRRLLAQGGSPFTAMLAGYLPAALIGVGQTVLLMLILQFVLGLQIDNLLGFYAFCLLVALVFAAIIQFFVSAFGLPGRFAAIIILMLQLTSAAGTFPLETTPLFFQTINPWLPMTYVVSGLRELMTGTNFDIAWQCAGILALFGAIFFIATCAVAQRKRTITMRDLHPVWNLMG
ncbi:MAG: YhgE/Pip domain-containing protein [Coriobacteriales bacterium]|jgi:putative membrane protein|nr:YhgE/Pip domain-containing protein [Coriobacteriales bacterium]